MPPSRAAVDSLPPSAARRGLQRRARRGRGRALLVALALAGVGLPACSEGARYRVLSYFFDGVPEPGATPPPRGYAREIETARRPFLVNEERAAPVAIAYAHEPFRQGDCTGCHNRTTGELVATPRGGLCRSCHPEVPGDLRYVHGPVAVSDCLFCHNAHGSGEPHVLVAEPTQLCLRCHDRGDLSTGAHHANADATGCSACHSAHGGADPYFLRPDRP